MSLKGKGRGIAFLRAHINEPEGDCLIWPMYCDDEGYAICAYHGRPHKAAAVMCELVNGKRPTGYHCAHSCGRGTGGCVHPKHVRWATPKANAQDNIELGAVRQPGRPFRKLLQEDVDAILALRGMPYRKIAPMFGVSYVQIGKIMRGQNWKDGRAGTPGFKVGDPRARVANAAWSAANARPR